MMARKPEIGPLISAEELSASGVLQEANRRYFHPLGLALTVNNLGAIMLADYREDPEGVLFEWGTTEGPAVRAKAANVDRLMENRREDRAPLCDGRLIQPLPT